MKYLNAEELRLGKENYEIGNYWQPTAYEYRSKPATVRAEDSKATGPTGTKGCAGKRPMASTGAGKSPSKHKARAGKA